MLRLDTSLSLCLLPCLSIPGAPGFPKIEVLALLTTVNLRLLYRTSNAGSFDTYGECYSRSHLPYKAGAHSAARILHHSLVGHNFVILFPEGPSKRQKG